MHCTHSSKGLKFQLVPSTFLWEHDQHHTEIAVITHCSTRCYARSGRQHSFICFTCSLLFYTHQTDSSIFCDLATTAHSLLRDWGFSAQFCISVFSLPVGTTEPLLNATTIAYPPFSSAQCLQLLCPSTDMSVPLNSYWCLLFSGSMRKG